MAAESPIPAKQAARLLGHPERFRTFTRRAQEAIDAGKDTRVYKAGPFYMAPLSFWREVTLRPVGRKPSPRYARRRRPSLDEGLPLAPPEQHGPPAEDIWIMAPR